MLLPFKLGGGGRVGSGRQWWSWVSLADAVSAYLFALEHPLEGPFNVAAPGAVTNEEFTKELGEALHRPTLLPAPAFALKTVFGEMADEMLLGGQRVSPAKLEAAGFTFAYPDLPAPSRRRSPSSSPRDGEHGVIVVAPRSRPRCARPAGRSPRRRLSARDGGGGRGPTAVRCWPSRAVSHTGCVPDEGGRLDECHCFLRHARRAVRRLARTGQSQPPRSSLTGLADWRAIRARRFHVPEDEREYSACLNSNRSAGTTG